MNRRAHPGHTPRERRARLPLSPLGVLVAERMAAIGLPAGMLAGRLGVSRATTWRLLRGRTGFTNRVSLVALCRALELDGEEWEAFIRICAGYEAAGMPDVGIPDVGQVAHPESAHPPAPDSSPGSGHAEGAAAARLLAFLRERIRAVGLSSSEFARRIGVQPSTITRLLRGETARAHALRERAVARALELDAPSRRTFLALALEAGLFAVIAPVSVPQMRFGALERRAGGSLDEIAREVVDLREQRNRGEVVPVVKRAGQLFAALFDDPRQTSTILHSPEVARVKLLVGFEFCEAQAATLGWYERAPAMIATLDRMQTEVIGQFPPRPARFASEHGHLLNLRAPLYRMRAGPESLDGAYTASIWELGWALEQVMPGVHEPTLRVELLRNRAHAHLLRGDERGWRADLDAADRVARSIGGAAGEVFQALVAYSWGEGYKRLLARPGLESGRARHLTREALDTLRQGCGVFARHRGWEGYALLAKIAEAQCLLREEPDEALRGVVDLRDEARRIYPSLVQKIERTIGAARSGIG